MVEGWPGCDMVSAIATSGQTQLETAQVVK